MNEQNSNLEFPATDLWCFLGNNGRKVVHVLSINDYFPALCEITIPNLKAYADKIGADFNVITERKFPDFPVTYEKLQVYELGKENEWNILIDADVMLHPDMPDVTKVAPPNIVLFVYKYEAHFLLRQDKYFMRDGRDVGIATGFVVTHNMCHDLWTPLEFPYSIARYNTKRQHIIDEYCLSRNLAKFGLQYTSPLPMNQQHLSCHLGAEGMTEVQKLAIVEKARRLDELWKAKGKL